MTTYITSVRSDIERGCDPTSLHHLQRNLASFDLSYFFEKSGPLFVFDLSHCILSTRLLRWINLTKLASI